MLRPLFNRYFPTKIFLDHEDSLSMIVSHLDKIARLRAGKKAPYRFWAGTEELMGAVMILREPIFVWDIEMSGVIHTQMYYIDYQRPLASNKSECVKTRSLEPWSAHRIFKLYHLHRVVPFILAIHHFPGKAHFMVIQMQSELYKTWNVRDDTGDTMRDRLD